MRIQNFLVSLAILPLIAGWGADAQPGDRAAVLEKLPYSNAVLMARAIQAGRVEHGQ